jgi:predicted aspartyl protease
MSRTNCLNKILLVSGLCLSFMTPAFAYQSEIPLEAVKAGTFYVKASLGGQVATDLLLDTGSGYVSLSKRTFDQIKHESSTIFQRNITGVMANGSAVSVPVYRIGELKLTSECVLYDIEVAVFSNTSRDILGLNALMQIQPFTLQLDPPVMTATCS